MLWEAELQDIRRDIELSKVIRDLQLSDGEGRGGGGGGAGGVLPSKMWHQQENLEEWAEEMCIVSKETCALSKETYAVSNETFGAEFRAENDLEANIRKSQIISKIIVDNHYKANFGILTSNRMYRACNLSCNRTYRCSPCKMLQVTKSSFARVCTYVYS